MSQIARKQDLPPPGGYRPIPFERVKAKTLASGVAMFAGFFVFNTITFYIFEINRKRIHREGIEMTSSDMALYPLLLAERDRAHLKHIRKNRDLEAELMKDVEGWEVGTLFGEPIYKTVDKDTFIKPTVNEFYIHGSKENFKKVTESWLWS